MTPRYMSGDVGDIQGGLDTVRVSTAPDAQAYRAEMEAAALRYLRRRYPGAVAELADMLGLSLAPAREPGRCACGAELPPPGTGREHRAQRRLGLCVDCGRTDGGEPS